MSFALGRCDTIAAYLRDGGARSRPRETSKISEELYNDDFKRRGNDGRARRAMPIGLGREELRKAGPARQTR